MRTAIARRTGLYYYRARYYSPALGRFLQTDPIGYEDNLNLYAYVGNDPVNGTDPTGEVTVSAKVSGGLSIPYFNEALSYLGFGVDKDNPNNASANLALMVSFPFFDNAEFDAGVSGGLSVGVGSYGIPELPGAMFGASVSIQKGSIVDQIGQNWSLTATIPLLRNGSKAVVGGLSKVLPNGKIKDFVDGPLSKAANTRMGLSITAGIEIDEESAISGIELGVSQGFNIEGGIDATLGACSISGGCRTWD